MNTFKMNPFSCPNCGDHLLVDSLKIEEDGTATLGKIFDQTAEEACKARGEHMGWRNELNYREPAISASIAALGRRDLEWLAQNQETFIRRLHWLERSRIGRFALRGIGVNKKDWWKWEKLNP